MSYVILPYVTTSRRFGVRGIVFRESDDFDGINPTDTEHLRRLFKLFFLQEELRFKKMAFSVLEETGQSSYATLVSRLWESSICLKYLCTCPNPPKFPPPILGGLHNYPVTEIAELFLFRPTNPTTSHFIEMSSQENVEYVGLEARNSFQRIHEGYSCAAIGRGSHFTIGKEGRIYPPNLSFGSFLGFRYATDISKVFDGLNHSSKWAIKQFISSEPAEESALEKRILKAMNWYNSSCEYGVTYDKSIAFLAIAFESLLSLKWGEDNTGRIKDILSTLLGSVERLSSWLDQFLRARGDIVHRGETSQVVFYPPKGDKGKHNEEMPISLLTDQGRQIFHLCLDAILSSSVTAHEANLSSQFKHDEERITEICKILNDSKIGEEERIVATKRLTLEMRGNIYQTASRVKPQSLLGVSKCLIKVYLAGNLHATHLVPESLVAKMKEFVSACSHDEEKAGHLRRFSNEIFEWYYDPSCDEFTKRDESLEAFLNFIGFASTRLEGFARSPQSNTPE